MGDGTFHHAVVTGGVLALGEFTLDVHDLGQCFELHTVVLLDELTLGVEHSGGLLLLVVDYHCYVPLL